MPYFPRSLTGERYGTVQDTRRFHAVRYTIQEAWISYGIVRYGSGPYRIVHVAQLKAARMI